MWKVLALRLIMPKSFGELVGHHDDACKMYELAAPYIDRWAHCDNDQIDFTTKVLGARWL
jgi:hypothetical protein